MITTKDYCFLLAIAAIVGVPTLHAENPSNSATSTVIAPADIGLEHDGKAVTMTFKITDTQLIGGEREGEFPHIKLHYDGMKKPPYLGVYVKGELADALHRFAYVSPDDKFVGRSITASGIIKIHKDFPKGEDPTPVYILDLRDWKQFQILPEPNPMSKLEGVWIAEKVTSSGEVVPKEKFPFELHFEKDKLIFRFVAPSLGKDRVHEIVVDETKTPATIDITREIRGKKETVYGIYKFEGDRLLICSLRDSNRQPSDERPTTFDSSNEVRSDLLVLARKPAPQK